MTTDIQLPTLFIRFNVGSPKAKWVLSKRLPLLLHTIEHMRPTPGSGLVSLTFLYYERGRDYHQVPNDEIEDQLTGRFFHIARRTDGE